MARTPPARPRRSARPARRRPGSWVFLVVLLAATWFESERQRAQALTERRLADLSAEASSRAELERVREEFLFLGGELARVREELAREVERAERLGLEAQERLDRTDEELGDIGRAVEAHASEIDGLIEDSLERGALALALEEREERVLSDVQARWASLSQAVATAQELADRSAERLARLDQELREPPDLGSLWREVVGPVVQLAGETSVGSGVLLASRPAADGSGHRTPLLTAWHVVRDIQGDLSRQDAPVPVTIYGEDGGLRSESATLLCFDPDLDAALLEIATAEPLAHGARLASRERLDALSIFDEVVAVGCPLGNDPIPTRGEIATRRHAIDGRNYWMINAPTYIGNSGGGIFDARTRELVGIFSKIYTHGSLRPTIVPHMGLATPLAAVYDWLEEQGHGELVPAPGAAAAQLASAGRATGE